ncbi:lasso peptide biosynthesis B2 protein [Bifidobacterium longum]|uniref:lasso peptide biosynthesis B2 protein n=1 Tax=Bifidobacterium longum TaxID=216816 RepID=UPI001BABDA4D|nr:lasso peptide biosynthesis B2 protein [Bifidobacterium longum]QUF85784.1 lasso peptide biosynthesis B2 protein [Bifidobacterium longum subsp. infantis]UPT09250.1 lasso peptide biosynthesis B2 protein [Bifidobacterium longum subsp. infantis]UUY27514.1 lasso peptide biosynthesis B2 protein [Bifidobacterium longum subsp. infantis]
MSSPIYMEHRAQLSLSERWSARLAVAAAYFIVKLKPTLLVRVLRLSVVEQGQADYTEVERIRTSVNSVSPRCAGNGCLQRSVAVMLIARFRKIPLTWKSGFRIKPFVAHAWVELNGQPVGENIDLSNFFVSLSVGDKS